MTTTFGEEYAAIHDEVATLHWSWQNFRELYVNSPTDFEVFNGIVPGFAYLAHFVLLNSVILAICRLTDPAQTGKFSNLSFGRLKNVLSPTASAKQLRWLESEIQKMYAEADKLRDY
jgi:hypothetical protein